MSMYKLIKCSDNYSNHLGFWGKPADEPALDIDGAIDNFNAANINTDSCKIKEKIIGQTDDKGTQKMK